MKTSVIVIIIFSCLLLNASAQAQYRFFQDVCEDGEKKSEYSPCFWATGPLKIKPDMIIGIQNVSGFNGRSEFVIYTEFSDRIHMSAKTEFFDGFGANSREVHHSLDSNKYLSILDLIDDDTLQIYAEYSSKYDAYGNERKLETRPHCWDGEYSSVFVYKDGQSYRFEKHSCNKAAPYDATYKKVLEFTKMADPKTYDYFINHFVEMAE